MRKYFILCVVFILFFATTPRAATVFETEKESLRGIKSFYVLVEDIKPEVSKYGLTSEQIQTDVELSLRKHGIKIISESESLLLNVFDTGRPFLYLQLTILTVKNINGTMVGFSYSINIKFKQYVSLIRMPIKSLRASTWERGEVGNLADNELGDIRNFVADKVDVFANDFLSVNQ